MGRMPPFLEMKQRLMRQVIPRDRGIWWQNASNPPLLATLASCDFIRLRWQCTLYRIVRFRFPVCKWSWLYYGCKLENNTPFRCI